MSLKVYMLENGDQLFVDADAPQATISRWVLEEHGNKIQRHARERLEFEMEKRKRDEALKRSESDDATLEREAICSYLEAEMKDSPFMPRFLFDAIRVHKIHHRKRSGT